MDLNLLKILQIKHIILKIIITSITPITIKMNQLLSKLLLKIKSKDPIILILVKIIKTKEDLFSSQEIQEKIVDYRNLHFFKQVKAKTFIREVKK
jgi:hypothetical protein